MHPVKRNLNWAAVAGENIGGLLWRDQAGQFADVSETTRRRNPVARNFWDNPEWAVDSGLPYEQRIANWRRVIEKLRLSEDLIKLLLAMDDERQEVRLLRRSGYTGPIPPRLMDRTYNLDVIAEDWGLLHYAVEKPGWWNLWSASWTPVSPREAQEPVMAGFYVLAVLGTIASAPGVLGGAGTTAVGARVAGLGATVTPEAAAALTSLSGEMVMLSRAGTAAEAMGFFTHTIRSNAALAPVMHELRVLAQAAFTLAKTGEVLPGMAAYLPVVRVLAQGMVSGAMDGRALASALGATGLSHNVVNAMTNITLVLYAVIGGQMALASIDQAMMPNPTQPLFFDSPMQREDDGMFPRWMLDAIYGSQHLTGEPVGRYFLSEHGLALLDALDRGDAIDANIAMRQGHREMLGTRHVWTGLQRSTWTAEDELQLLERETALGILNRHSPEYDFAETMYGIEAPEPEREPRRSKKPKLTDQELFAQESIPPEQVDEVLNHPVFLRMRADKKRRGTLITRTARRLREGMSVDQALREVETEAQAYQQWVRQMREKRRRNMEQSERDGTLRELGLVIDGDQLVPAVRSLPVKAVLLEHEDALQAALIPLLTPDVNPGALFAVILEHLSTWMEQEVGDLLAELGMGGSYVDDPPPVPIWATDESNLALQELLEAWDERQARKADPWLWLALLIVQWYTRSRAQVAQRLKTWMRMPERKVRVETALVWKTENDANVCQVCWGLEGMPEEIWREQFPAGPPAHFFCRCHLKVVKL